MFPLAPLALLALVAASFAPLASAAGQFSFVNVAAAVAMVALAVALSRWQRLGLERDVVLASVRAFVQLMLIGYVIHLIFRADSLWLVAAMIAAMVVFAAITSGQRLAGLPGRYAITLAAIGLSSLVTLGLMVGLGIIDATPAYLIPIGGMIVGNSMNVASVTGLRLIEDAATQRATIEAGLALAASPRRALQPVFRRSVRLAMVPTIDSTRTMGLVFLPGAMTGMIIAGADPMNAVRLQVVIMYMLIAAVTVTAVITALLVSRALFTAAQQLRRLP
jgi:putative ABC transport system permease protein